MDQTRQSRATFFGGWADEDHLSRPSYPDTAVTWLLGDARRVIEVGAGTGKLTDRLVDLGSAELTVTEIDVRMLRLIGMRHPALPAHEAGATDLPIDDNCVDAVLVADAWQWFPKEKAAAEVRRVLRPGGWLGCIWNDMAPTTPTWQWDAVRLSADIAAQVRAMAPIERLGLETGLAEQVSFRWHWELTPDQFGDFVATLSHVRTLPDEERLESVAVARQLALDACDREPASTLPVVFDAVCIRWDPQDQNEGD